MSIPNRIVLFALKQSTTAAVVFCVLLVFSHHSYAAVTRTYAATQAAYNAQTITINKPPAQNGDVLILLVHSTVSYGSSLPVGFTRIGSAVYVPSDLRFDAFYRVLDGTEPSGWTLDSGYGSTRWNVGVVIYRGCDAANPIDVSGYSTGTPGNNTDAPSLSTTVPNTLVVAAFTLYTWREKKPSLNIRVKEQLLILN